MSSAVFTIAPFQSDEILESLKASGIILETIGGSVKVTGIAPIDDCGPGDLAFADKEKFLATARQRKPACLVLNGELKDKLQGDEPFTIILVRSVGLAHAWIRQRFGDINFGSTEDWGRVHPSAVIHESTKIPDSVVI
ncbi:MAG: hypothetical protein KDK23_10645, partial [Leptospiraceae bacterium]|nr:hypothetical protein [Leptospiraceae bacterium]